MATDPRLERYLANLEKALMAFPVSDRADIITEIKSHVDSALERDPEARLDSILASLGEPETVANRYLLERGMKPAKTAIHPIVKWMVIGFLGTFALTLIFCGFLVVHFGSLLKIDGDNVQMLGGLIKIDGKDAQVSIGNDTATAFAGEQNLKLGDTVVVKFTNGKIAFKTSDTGKLAWGCKASGSSLGGAKTEGTVTTLDFNQFRSTKCEIAIPKGMHLQASGDNGKVDIERPQYDMDLKMDNSKVGFQEDPTQHYKYDFSVQNGKVDNFQSSTDANALNIKIRLDNGKIAKD